jgi:uncharacterized protein YbjT (DUF2867 family)
LISKAERRNLVRCVTPWKKNVSEKGGEVMKRNRMNVLVTGATGKQGSHVARLLLKNGHSVHAFTRKSDSPAARELAKLGANIVTGDLSDRASVERGVEGVDAIFAMSTPFEAGMEAETKQGVTVADAAKAKGKYLVYTSVGSANKNTGIPHFDSKWRVEQHIAKIGAEAAIIAPVYFMENLIAFGKQQLKEGMYATPLRPDRKLAQIALDDIASFAVLALENKERFIGKRIDLASDDLTGGQVAEILTRVIGKPIKYFQVPIENIRKMSEDITKMYEWFERVGYSVDTALLRRDYPEVGWHTYEAWAKEQDWKQTLSG